MVLQGNTRILSLFLYQASCFPARKQKYFPKIFQYIYIFVNWIQLVKTTVKCDCCALFLCPKAFFFPPTSQICPTSMFDNSSTELRKKELKSDHSGSYVLVYKLLHRRKNQTAVLTCLCPLLFEWHFSQPITASH